MTHGEIDNLPVRELVPCQGCGGYHSPEECEVIVIKIIKGKNCPLPSSGGLRTEPASIRDRVIEKPLPEQAALKEAAPVAPAKVVPRKNIIPQGISSMMIPPTSPNFETNGAKEIRRV